VQLEHTDGVKLGMALHEVVRSTLVCINGNCSHSVDEDLCVLSVLTEKNFAVSNKVILTLKQTFCDLVRETVCGYLQEFPYLCFPLGREYV
jgi:hypothetical protein